MPGPDDRLRARLAAIGQQLGQPSRASKWHSCRREQLIALGRAGIPRKDWPSRLGVTSRTLWRWAAQHPEFHEALKSARLRSTCTPER